MKLRNRTLIRLIARVIAGVLRVWFRTVRWQFVEDASGVNAYNSTADRRYFFCVWHDAIFGVIFARRPTQVAGLVSLHADGSYVADVMEVLNIRPIRGSSGRRGAGAVREMMEAARDWHIAIATDGPRGPRRQVKDGVVYLASQTGRPIVAVAVAGRHAWKPRGKWTDMVLPLPFTRAWMLGSAPIHIPAGLRPDQLPPYRELVQREMDDLTARAERAAVEGRCEPQAAALRRAA